MAQVAVEPFPLLRWGVADDVAVPLVRHVAPDGVNGSCGVLKATTQAELSSQDEHIFDRFMASGFSTFARVPPWQGSAVVGDGTSSHGSWRWLG